MIRNEVADKAVKFIRALRHTKGKWAGVKFNLQPWQENEIIRPLFGKLKRDGTRQYRTAYIELPRKQGKSEIAAAIALYMLFMDGEQGAEIYSAAADRDQASLVFNVATAMVRQSPTLRKMCKIVESQKRIVVHSTNSFYRAISAEAYSKHGFNASCVIYDELHAAPNRELWDVLSTSQGARTQPLMIAITTAGYDRNSICWEQHDYAKRILSGVVKDKTFLPVIYAAEDTDDWTDEKVWAKCNPAMSGGKTHFRNIDEMRALAAKAMEIPALQNTFRRLYLNQWTSQDTRWIDLTLWDDNAGLFDELALHGQQCYLGLDLSTTTDLSALVAVFPGGEVLAEYWLPEQGIEDRERKDRVPYRQWAKMGRLNLTPGNVIDYQQIRLKVQQWGKLYDVQEVAHDPWNATQLSLDLTGDDFTMVPIRQGFASLTAPTKELMNLLLARKLKHGGHPVLRWNADSVAVEQDAAGNIKPSKRKSTQRIDGIVALIMAVDRRSRHEDTTPVYENGGVFVI